MKVSIITVTFNSEKTVEKTVNSVISQTYKNIEHIIIDNISSDRTIEIVRSIHALAHQNIKSIIISEKDNGISDAFNKGIHAASGDIILLLHSDDYLYDNYVVEKTVHIFKKENPDFTHGNVLFIDETYGTNIRFPIMKSLHHGMPFCHPGMFIKKEIYLKLGNYSTKFKFSMDFELICRMYKTVHQCRLKGFYINGEPLVTMMAGGMSWKHEFKTLYEQKESLKLHNFWSLKSSLYLYNKIIRIYIKKILLTLHLQNIIKCWRNYKWKTKASVK